MLSNCPLSLANPKAEKVKVMTFKAKKSDLIFCCVNLILRSQLMSRNITRTLKILGIRHLPFLSPQKKLLCIFPPVFARMHIYFSGRHNVHTLYRQFFH